MYSLILVLGTTISTVGSYHSLAACQEGMKQFTDQGVKAGCVAQADPKEAMEKMQSMMKHFMERR